MKTVQLGNTNEQVSAQCLGTMYFGSSTDQEMSYRLLDQYTEQGGAFLDTANIYARWIPGSSGGESEELLGRWMKERENRSQLFIATKVGFEMPDVERGLKAKQIVEECEKSLKRMKIDSVDLFYAHVDDRNTPLEETLEAFSRLVKEGKVRYIGASNYYAWRLEQAKWLSQSNDWPEFCCIQQRHTYLRPVAEADFGPQVAANTDLLDYCSNRGMTMLAYSPLLGGSYTRADRPLPEQYVSAHNDARLNVLKQIAGEKNATANQIVLAWMLHSQPTVIPVMSGSNSMQLQENMDALKIELNDNDMERLNSALS